MEHTLSTILIVDDTPENIDILSDLLQGFYKIKAVRNGKQALEVARREPHPDMILLDIMMPEMDGYEAIRELKSDPATEEIPVIFITAKGATGDETKGFALGAADYISKPFSPPVVMARIGAHLTIYKQKKAIEQQNHELKKALRVLENKLARFDPKCDPKKEEPVEEVVQKIEDHEDYFLDDHRIDLFELIEEIDSTVHMILLRNRFEPTYINRAGTLLIRYAQILILYPIFKRLGTGMYDFGILLNKPGLNPTQQNMEFAYGCLESLIYTLDRWHNQIFSNQIKNPNIFDNSMLADMETIQKALENDYGNEEIEFF